MKVCFVDRAPWDYNVASPTVIPLGGSQSALCYLAIKLAKLGHEITVVTGTSKPGVVLGVQCINPSSLSRQFFADSAFDAVVALNSAKGHRGIRSFLPASTKLILWTQHAADQPGTLVLRDRRVRDGWDHVVCVSDWQRRGMLDLGVSPERCSVVRNAISPSFERMFATEDELVAAKSVRPLRLTYTSTPYRGVHLLLDLLPAFRAANPGAMLDIYSSMAVYMGQEESKFAGLYERLKAADGIEYAGSLPQPVLAGRLRSAHILSYPNIFPETSCIAVMEAMAAGLQVVTSHLGALPETTEGFARLVPLEVDIDLDAALITLRDQPAYIAAFAEALAVPYSTDRLFAQVEHMNCHHTWAVRAQQWTEFLHAA